MSSSPRKRKRATAARHSSSQASYVDHSDLSDNDDHDGNATDKDNKTGHKFKPEEKLHFPQLFVLEVDNGGHLNVAYFQKHGFNTPLVIRCPNGLKLRMPKSSSFDVSSVRQMVGGARRIDVMDCRTQRNVNLSMKDFEQYFKGKSKERKVKLYNVISLEFSNTKLAKHVAAPKVVRQIDWTDNAWPRHLKEMQTEGTNELREMMYPKVQKYCLMSVAGCYTDFHVDFGGTSVWYHVLKGRKIFWIIPPTETNLKLYEQWTLSGKQNTTFFGDVVDKCGMVTLEAGNTFLIPSGWIHAVLTPEDSLVFGGNFLNSFSMERQIRIAQIEETTKVPQKFRFPFFTELHWYVLDKYVYHLLGRTHLHLSPEAREQLYGPIKEENDEDVKLSSSPSPLSSPSLSSPPSSLSSASPSNKKRKREANKRIHLTPYELLGIKAIVMYLHALPVTKKSVPALITNPLELIRDVRRLVELHDNDNPVMAITDSPILFWPAVKGLQNKRLKRSKKMSSANPQRRVSCQVCQACIGDECGTCTACSKLQQLRSTFPETKEDDNFDVENFKCQMRKCLQPILKKETLCQLCNLDGWKSDPDSCILERPDGKNQLLECQHCFEVCHPFCFPDNGVDGILIETLPNAWKCPRCSKEAKKEMMMQFQRQQKSNQPHPTSQQQGQSRASLQSQEEPHKDLGLMNPAGIKVQTGCDANYKGSQLFVVRSKSNESKAVLRKQLSKQIMAATSHLRSPSHVFRPPPSEENLDDFFERRAKMKVEGESDLKFEAIVLLPIFKYLNTHDLAKCSMVCKVWNRVSQHPLLCHSLKFDDKKVTPSMLSMMVRRQPLQLSIAFSPLSKPQLQWLLPRIPQTRSLSLSGQDVNVVTALATCNCPMLNHLDLSFVFGLNDGTLYKILAAPSDSRPGLVDKNSRLKGLKSLSLRHTEVSSVAMKHIGQLLPQLKVLNLSQCWKVGDEAVTVLTSFMPSSMSSLDISQCKWITENGLVRLMSTCSPLSTIVALDIGMESSKLKHLASYNNWELNESEQILMKCNSESSNSNGL